MRKHAGRPGRKKWARRIGKCVKCANNRVVDDASRCKQCRRDVPEATQ